MLDRVARRASDVEILVWTTTTSCLVAPRAFARRPGFEAGRARVEARGMPLMLRETGGDLAPQGPSVLNVTLAFAASSPFGVEDAYGRLCSPLLALLARAGRRGPLRLGSGGVLRRALQYRRRKAQARRHGAALAAADAPRRDGGGRPRCARACSTVRRAGFRSLRRRGERLLRRMPARPTRARRSACRARGFPIFFRRTRRARPARRARSDRVLML